MRGGAGCALRFFRCPRMLPAPGHRRHPKVRSGCPCSRATVAAACCPLALAADGHLLGAPARRPVRAHVGRDRQGAERRGLVGRQRRHEHKGGALRPRVRGALGRFRRSRVHAARLQSGAGVQAAGAWPLLPAHSAWPFAPTCPHVQPLHAAPARTARWLARGPACWGAASTAAPAAARCAPPPPSRHPPSLPCPLKAPPSWCISSRCRRRSAGAAAQVRSAGGAMQAGLRGLTAAGRGPSTRVNRLLHQPCAAEIPLWYSVAGYAAPAPGPGTRRLLADPPAFTASSAPGQVSAW